MEKREYQTTHLYTLAVREGGLLVIPEELDRIKKSVSYRLMCVADGTCKLFVSGVSYILQKNDLCFFCPDDVYRTVPLRNANMLNIYFSFDPEDLKNFSYTEEIDQSTPIRKFDFYDAPLLNTPFVLKNFADGTDCANQMLHDIRHNHPYLQKQLDNRLETLLLHIICYHELLVKNRSLDKKQKIISKIEEYVQMHIHDKLTCSDVASHFGYHPNYLNEIIKTTKGISLRRYILEQKIASATVELVSSDLSIAQIAQNFSFFDCSHFDKCYFKITGLQPSEVRNAAKK